MRAVLFLSAGQTFNDNATMSLAGIELNIEGNYMDMVYSLTLPNTVY